MTARNRTSRVEPRILRPMQYICIAWDFFVFEHISSLQNLQIAETAHEIMKYFVVTYLRKENNYV